MKNHLTGSSYYQDGASTQKGAKKFLRAFSN